MARLLQILAKRQRHLLRSAALSPSPQRARNSLLQHLQNLRRIAFFRFAHQQMHVLRHHHVPEQPEPESEPNFTQNYHKSVPRPRRPEIRPSPMTTERHKVEIPLPVMPPQRIAHRGKVKTRTLTNQRVRHPHLLPIICRARMILSPALYAQTYSELRSLRHPPERATKTDHSKPGESEATTTMTDSTQKPRIWVD